MANEIMFNVYMDGVVREVNVRMFGKGLELLSANGGRFEVNQLLFADDTELVADSEEKLCRLVSECGRVLLLLLKMVGSARLRESDVHPISPKTPAPQYQLVDRKKRKGKRVEDYSKDRAT